MFEISREGFTPRSINRGYIVIFYSKDIILAPLGSEMASWDSGTAISVKMVLFIVKPMNNCFLFKLLYILKHECCLLPASGDVKEVNILPCNNMQS